MKKYIATFWRENPQHPMGGYETTREITASSLTEARKKANNMTKRMVYGGMVLDSIKLA